jgi:hypothetical protein
VSSDKKKLDIVGEKIKHIKHGDDDEKAVTQSLKSRKRGREACTQIEYMYRNRNVIRSDKLLYFSSNHRMPYPEASQQLEASQQG